MNKRENGQGTIRKRNNGLYEVRYTFNGKRKSVYCKTEEEAKEKLKKVLANITLDQHFEPSKMKLSNWLNTWLFDYKQKYIKPKTFESYEQVVRLYINPAIGHISLDRLINNDIQLMLNKMKVGARSIRYTYTVLKMALKKAKSIKYIRDNPAEDISLPKPPKRNIKILDAESIEKFLDAVDSNRYGLAYLLAIGTGMRKGEILALRWQDVDFNAEIIKVSRTLNRVKVFEKGKFYYKMLEGANKTDKSDRIVIVLPDIIERLKSHYMRTQIDALAKGNKLKQSEHIFLNQYGKCINPRTFEKNYKNFLKNAGISMINFHALRHTFASISLERGVSIKAISEILGHSSVSFTTDVYIHLHTKTKKSEIAKLAPVFSPRRGKTRGTATTSDLSKHSCAIGDSNPGPTD